MLATVSRTSTDTFAPTTYAFPLRLYPLRQVLHERVPLRPD